MKSVILLHLHYHKVKLGLGVLRDVQGRPSEHGDGKSILVQARSKNSLLSLCLVPCPLGHWGRLRYDLVGCLLGTTHWSGSVLVVSTV